MEGGELKKMGERRVGREEKRRGGSAATKKVTGFREVNDTMASYNLSSFNLFSSNIAIVIIQVFDLLFITLSHSYSFISRS